MSQQQSRILTPLLLTYALSIYGALGGLPGQPEHEVHLFCSSHYLERYFDLWDSRWYSGFSLTGHPPLAHELVSLLARVPYLGLERAYALMIVVAAVALVVSAASLVTTLAGVAPARHAAWLLAVYPYLYLFLFPLGQLPFILGVALALGACAAFAEAERTGCLPFRVMAVGLGESAVTTHPLALPVLAIGLAAVASVRCARNRKPLRTWIRAGVIGAAAAAIGGAATWPFWRQLLTGQLRPLSYGPTAWNRGMSAIAIPLIAIVAILALLQASNWGTWAAAMLTLLLLGSSIWLKLPIASDKLLWFSGLVAVLGLASSDLPKLRLAQPVGVVLIVGLLVACSVLLGRPGVRILGEQRQAMREVSSFLARPGNESWRYVTLGLGNDRLELGRRSRVGSIDGGMPWLASIPELRATPFLSIDELPLTDGQSTQVLQQILARSRELSLRWVISANNQASPILKNSGFVLRSAWKGSVVLWENENVPPLVPGAISDRGPKAFAWGFIPPALLASALLLGVWQSSFGLRRKT